MLLLLLLLLSHLVLGRFGEQGLGQPQAVPHGVSLTANLKGHSLFFRTHEADHDHIQPVCRRFG